MDNKVFAELLQSATEALEHAKGKRELRTTELPPTPQPVVAAEIKRLRACLNMSQAVFAHYLNVSTKLVQAWESKRREPEGPALLLLRLVERHPPIILSAWTLERSPTSAKKVRRTRVRLAARRTRHLVPTG